MVTSTTTQRLTRNELLARGWTDRLIKELLDPSAQTPNPKRPTGTLMNLYDWDVVVILENSKEFKYACHSALKDQRLYEGTLRWAKQAKINLTKNLRIASLIESPGLRDIVAHIRHRSSNYEKLMATCDNRFAPKEAKKIIRLRLMRMIAKVYPGLREGCCQQWYHWYQTAMP